VQREKRPRALLGRSQGDPAAGVGRSFHPLLADGPTAETFLRDILGYLRLRHRGAVDS